MHLPTTTEAIIEAIDGGQYTALSYLMDFDHPIVIGEDGTVTDGPTSLYAPDLFDGELDSDKWEMMNGYSGQDSYAGPVMHDSEFIGGGMARDILGTPGTYVAVVGCWSPDEDDEDDEYAIEGWAVARLVD